MTTLFVTHSTGDTNAIIATIDKLSTMPHDKLYLLVVGQAAKNIIQTLPDNSPVKRVEKTGQLEVIHIDDIVGEKILPQYDNLPLTDKHLDNIISFIQSLHIDRALIGTPSQIKAAAPFQIAQAIASILHTSTSTIFNDYLFNEPTHIFNEVAKTPAEWQKHYSWFVPLSKAKQRLKQLNPNLHVEAIGHPMFDNINQPALHSNSDHAEIKQQLQVNLNQTLVFISGIKETADDLALLHAMLQALQAENFSPISIRLGIHPGIAEPLDYYRKICELLKTCPLPSAQQCKIILPKLLADKLKPEEIAEQFTIISDLKSNQIIPYADAVACAVPATLTTTTAIEGKPAYSHQSDKSSDLPEDRLFVGEQCLGMFFSEAAKRSVKPMLTKKDLGLIEKQTQQEFEAAAEMLAKRLSR